MPFCYVVPGFLSSELYRAGGRRELIWLDQSQAILGNLGKMRLAPNGVDPGPPDGLELISVKPLPSIWESPIQQLTTQLFDDNIGVLPWAWDWRKDIYEAGQGLATSIRAFASRSEPCTLVGHSAGGLVCRAAWADLVSTGEEDLVRRLITMASPHQGTYFAPAAISGVLDFEAQLDFLNIIGSNLNQHTQPYELFTRWSIRDYYRLVATWPAFYELFPQLGGSDAVGDPLRDLLYNAANWPSDIGLSQAWLDYAKGPFAAFLRSPQSRPPSWVLTTVVGIGEDTIYRLNIPEKLGTLDAFNSTTFGDNTVTDDSATIEESANYRVSCNHSDFPRWAVQSGRLHEWILDPRGPITPTPPVVDIAGVVPPMVGDPPLAPALGGFVASGMCRSADCKC